MQTTDKNILRQSLKRFSKTRILVIGDIIIDHFIWGSVNRISPEAPVPVVNVTRENLLLGGAANVLNNIYQLGGQASLCGVIGRDIMGDHLLQLLEELGSSGKGLLKTINRPTTKKTRIIAQHQQVVRFDREQTGALPAADTEKLTSFLTEQISSFDAVIVSDYNKGIISREIMAHLRELLQENPGIPLVIDPKPSDIDRFHGAAIITPNNHEAELMSGLAIHDEQSLAEAASRIKEKLQIDSLLITRGEAGMALFEGSREPYNIPTVAREVFDVTGAGDTVAATLALGLAAGLSHRESAVLANQAAGIVVGKLGTATASPKEISEALR